jgi:hypothetical protein
MFLSKHKKIIPNMGVLDTSQNIKVWSTRMTPGCNTMAGKLRYGFNAPYFLPSKYAIV